VHVSLQFPKDAVTGSIRSALETFVSVNVDTFTPEKMKRASSDLGVTCLAAASRLCAWILALLRYSHVSTEMEPKRAALRAAEEAIDASRPPPAPETIARAVPPSNAPRGSRPSTAPPTPSTSSSASTKPATATSGAVGVTSAASSSKSKSNSALHSRLAKRKVNVDVNDPAAAELKRLRGIADASELLVELCSKHGVHRLHARF
jgi:hypothetical protein